MEIKNCQDYEVTWEHMWKCLTYLRSLESLKPGKVYLKQSDTQGANCDSMEQGTQEYR